MALIVVDLDEMDILYDPENDVVYVSLGPIQEADDSEMLPNGIVVRYKDGKPIGLTAVGTKGHKNQHWFPDFFKRNQASGL